MGSNIHTHFPLPRGRVVAVLINQDYLMSEMAWAKVVG